MNIFEDYSREEYDTAKSKQWFERGALEQVDLWYFDGLFDWDEVDRLREAKERDCYYSVRDFAWSGIVDSSLVNFGRRYVQICIAGCVFCGLGYVSHMVSNAMQDSPEQVDVGNCEVSERD